ncbi:MAG: hypothetical protein M1817_004012 [Caeruleum heppii]|nr:MAG: hypothetical protein M1817_004012 [Caeruleum heppii]
MVFLPPLILSSLVLSFSASNVAATTPSRPFLVSRDYGETLARCLTTKQVPVSLMSSANFADLAEPYNLRLPYTPEAIVLAQTQQHVSDAVICATQLGFKVQAKSGGHSYASFSSGGKNGSLIVDLSPMQNIELDPRTSVARVGAGVRLGNLAQGIYDLGYRGLPHGTCPGVGIGGHFTHGGYGYTSREWGLALDTIVSMDVVLANGTTTRASRSLNPDLFFSLRGAADSFGIVTTFNLQTQRAPQTVINFSFGIPAVMSSRQSAASAFLHLQDFGLNSSAIDRRLSFGITSDGPNGPSFRIGGTFFGGLDEFNNRIAAEMLRGLPPPATSNVRELDWIASLTDLAGGPLVQPLTGYDLHDTFFVKSIVTQESRPLTRAALESFWGYIIDSGVNASNPWFTSINLYGGPDSRISNPPFDFAPAAYPHRDALWVFQNYGYARSATPPFPPSIIPFVTDLTASLTDAQPDGDFAAYLNYVDPSLSATEAHQLYYGEEIYARLREIKRVVDPGELFWNPQAVGAED